jgi:hypothetical protein
MSTVRYLLPLLLLSSVFALQDTNIYIEKWASYQNEGELKVFGKAAAAEDKLVRFEHFQRTFLALRPKSQ